MGIVLGLLYSYIFGQKHSHTLIHRCAYVPLWVVISFFIRFVFFLTECYCFIFAPFFSRRIFYVICLFSFCMYVYLFTVFTNRDACSFMLPPVLARCIPIKVISLKVLRAFSVISIRKTTKKKTKLFLLRFSLNCGEYQITVMRFHFVHSLHKEENESARQTRWLSVYILLIFPKHFFLSVIFLPFPVVVLLAGKLFMRLDNTLLKVNF